MDQDGIIVDNGFYQSGSLEQKIDEYLSTHKNWILKGRAMSPLFYSQVNMPIPFSLVVTGKFN